ncbi:hypothetical protein BOSEA31B_20803 [Hyphomicrobiales bacterium]|jgi:outer membrane protein OmpA-like peptidoglycan-associated protein|nr:hypothetical protein BOSEA31B_20803 [Hyphomicrobiales bacterium]CAI0346889.1 hypothetical protein BO1005MUT1_530065 [Hyphomicrobiales bacterium]
MNPAPAGGTSVFMPGAGVRRIEDVRARRQRFEEAGTTIIREPGRVITRERGQTVLRHDENARFQRFGAPISQERRGGEIWTTWARPGGGQLVSITDLDGRLLRRIRRPANGGEHIIVDNGWRRPRHGVRPAIVILPPIEMLNPGELTILNDGREAETLSSTWSLGPVVPLDQLYELDQVRFSPTLRSRMRAVELGGVSFDTGSWALDQTDLNALSLVASAIQSVLGASPNEIFLVEGHTGRSGNEIDNLSLSDRRAEAVAEALTQMGVPPENLVVQGYGDAVPRDEGRSRSARDDNRILVRRITPLLAPAG